MDETALLLFLGYLRALKAIAIEYDQEKETYVEKLSGKTVGAIVREFLRDWRPVPKEYDGPPLYGRD